MRSTLGFVVVLGLSAAGCADHHSGGGGDAPIAPSMLAASVLSGGAHLTWKDNADNEAHYMVLRKEVGGASFELIASPTFDATQYHDGSTGAGTSYVYQVIAMSETGVESDPSNEVTIAIP